jgi:hypothetical protein
MKKFAMTEKRVKFLVACRDSKALAGRTGFKAFRLYNFSVDGLSEHDFNAQADDLEHAGYIKVGLPIDGQWGPRKVELTDKGREALKKFPV